jgi:S1-C subfamily serine protease
MRFFAGLLAVALWLTQTPTASAQSQPINGQPQPQQPVNGQAQQPSANVHAQLQKATGFVVVNKGNNQLGYGTCWVVDADKKLAITNVHVVTTFTDVRVWFARYDNAGKALTNSATYTSNDFVTGKVIYRDTKRDLALLQLKALPAGTQALGMAAQSIEAGQSIYSIGNSGMAGKQLNGGTLWRQRTGKVKKGFFWRTKLTNVDQNLEVRVIQTDSGVQGGDSGGPIVDAKLKLVGVVSCNNNEGDYGIDVGEVRTFLQRAQGKAPPPPHPAAGTWTVSWTYKGKDYYAGMTLNADGTGLWEASKQFPGTYTYAKGQLTLNLPSSGVNTTNNTLTWANNDQFTFVIQYSDGPTTFTAVRR